jgi:RNA polymerase sigma-70 factor (ECF subfamily)
MEEGKHGDLHALLLRMTQGDPAARAQVVSAAYERVRRLARVILNEDFPALKSAPSLLQTTDVANEAVVGIYTMLAEIQPRTPLDFYRLAAQRIRWLLLDRSKAAERTRREQRRSVEKMPSPTPSDTNSESLESLYTHIEGLPEQERQVVDLLYFHGLLQSEAADILGVTERSVRRYWTSARLHLSQTLHPSFALEAPNGCPP